ncbi:hypothetical protein D3C72_1491470 [compost metagenome]
MSFNLYPHICYKIDFIRNNIKRFRLTNQRHQHWPQGFRNRLHGPLLQLSGIAVVHDGVRDRSTLASGSKCLTELSYLVEPHQVEHAWIEARQAEQVHFAEQVHRTAIHPVQWLAVVFVQFASKQVQQFIDGVVPHLKGKRTLGAGAKDQGGFDAQNQSTLIGR